MTGFVLRCSRCGHALHAEHADNLNCRACASAGRFYECGLDARPAAARPPGYTERFCEACGEPLAEHDPGTLLEHDEDVAAYRSKLRVFQQDRLAL